MIDMTFKLGPSTNPITNIYTTELHVCKPQLTSLRCLQLSYMFVNNNIHPQLVKMCFPCFSIAYTLVDMYMKLQALMAQCALMCSQLKSKEYVDGIKRKKTR